MSKKANGFKLETGITPPGSKYTNWPFGKMKVGQSFLVPFSDILACRSAAAQYKRRSNGVFDYITRKTDQGYRLWRIAP